MAASVARLPVHLRVGEVESVIGVLEVELRLDSEPLGRHAVGVSATAGDIRPTLAAFLRAAAEKIEKDWAAADQKAAATKDGGV
jgi:hypothetical protein